MFSDLWSNEEKANHLIECSLGIEKQVMEHCTLNKEDINDTVLNCSYILSTIKYNSNIVKLSLEDDFLKNKEEKYNVFSSKNNNDDSFLRYEEK